MRRKGVWVRRKGVRLENRGRWGKGRACCADCMSSCWHSCFVGTCMSGAQRTEQSRTVRCGAAGQQALQRRGRMCSGRVHADASVACRQGCRLRRSHHGCPLTSGGASAPPSPCRRGPPHPPHPAGTAAQEETRLARSLTRRQARHVAWYLNPNWAPPCTAHACRCAPPRQAAPRVQRPAQPPHLRGAQRLLDGQPCAADVGHEALPEGGVGEQGV